MTTRVTTNEVQVLKRTWRDLDPKVRNALDAWFITLALVICGLSFKTLDVTAALELLTPITIAVSTAYITTSKHKELILDVGKTVSDAADVALVAVPKSAPVATLVKRAVEDVENPPDDPSFTQVISDAETKVIPSAGERFLAHLPSNQPPQIISADGH